jgi:hypothetical protein
LQRRPKSACQYNYDLKTLINTIAGLLLLYAAVCWCAVFVNSGMDTFGRFGWMVSHAWNSWKRSVLIVAAWLAVAVPLLNLPEFEVINSFAPVALMLLVAYFAAPRGYLLLNSAQAVHRGICVSLLLFLLWGRARGWTLPLLPAAIPAFASMAAAAYLMRMMLPPYFLVLGVSGPNASNMRHCLFWILPFHRAIDMRAGAVSSTIDPDRMRASVNWVIQVERLMGISAIIILDLRDGSNNLIETEKKLLGELRLWPKTLVIGPERPSVLFEATLRHAGKCVSGWPAAATLLRSRPERKKLEQPR